MKKTEEKSSHSAEGLYKFFIYFVLILLAVTIIVPVAWVFMASIKQNAEFYGNPWTLPAGFHWQNFVDSVRVPPSSAHSKRVRELLRMNTSVVSAEQPKKSNFPTYYP